MTSLLNTWFKGLKKSNSVLVIHILPSHRLRGFQLRLSKPLIRSILFMLAILLSYTIGTSLLALKNELELWKLNHHNKRINNLITAYHNHLKTHSIAIAPQETYISNQLASWTNLKASSSLAIGGGTPQKKTRRPADLAPPTTLASSSNFYQTALEEKQKLLLAAPELINVLNQDLDTIEANKQVLSNLYREITSHKGLISALPILWPIEGGWGEINTTTTETTPSNYTATTTSSNSPFHTETTIRVLPNTPVIATANGVVRNLTRSLTDPLAWNITIEHDYSIQTFYRNIYNPNVKVGDLVKKQQHLGQTGHTLGYNIKIAEHFASPAAFSFIRY
ncbi:hypothetical protein COTS27_00062 [Spirochaetota bacterium]|nr:hypothetical protein COTS27_00062 [Spirochaetota bacterium]